MTAVGILFIVIGLLAFVFSDQWLYRLLILSIPFSATVVLNVGSDANSSGVQLWMYFGTLWLLRELGMFCLFPQRRISVPLLRSSVWILVFVSALFLSLLMPIYINGSLKVVGRLLFDNATTPVQLQSRNITALLYMVFGALLTLSISNRNLRPGQFLATEKLYLIAGLITGILGLIEFLSNLGHLPSPTLLLRNNALSGSGGEAMLTSGLTRVASVSTEPSIMAQFLVSVLPLTLRSFVGMAPVISTAIDRFALCLIVLVLLVSTSTAGYAGVLMFYVFSIAFMRKLNFPVRRLVGYGLIVIATVALIGSALYTLSPVLQASLDEIILFKGASYSALERAKAFSYAWSYFESYPILGVGWGSFASHDIVILILSNSGVVGLAAFALMIWKVGRPLYKGIGHGDNSAIAASRAVWMFSGTLLLLVSAVSEFPYVFGYMWVVLSMCVTCGLTEAQTHPEEARGLVF